MPLARRILARLTAPVAPLAVERVESGGYSGAIFFVDVASGPPLVIKVYPSEPSWRMAKEFYAAGLLSRAAGVVAPESLACNDTTIFCRTGSAS